MPHLQGESLTLVDVTAIYSSRRKEVSLLFLSEVKRYLRNGKLAYWDAVKTWREFQIYIFGNFWLNCFGKFRALLGVVF